ncbi:alpha-glucoside ABC transporter substrate-binding protein [Streptomyces sp. NPDC002004]
MKLPHRKPAPMEQVSTEPAPTTPAHAGPPGPGRSRPRPPRPGRPRPVRALRTALVLCLLALTALSSGGCARGGHTTLRVLGPWTGDEGKAFAATLRTLDHDGYTYTYEGTSSLRETLVAQLEAGDPPDVAILNSIGELSDYARRHKAFPLRGGASKRAYAPWAPTLLVDGVRDTYWVPLKVDLKSLVWSKRGTPSSDRRWCVGLASQATSGWPGTDWIEDILLHRSGPQVYGQWATGQLHWNRSPVREAFTTWASLLGRRSADSIRRSLTTSYMGPSDGRDGQPRGLLNSMDCAHEHENAYIRYVYARTPVRWEPSARYLPGPSEYDGAYEVSGDMAAVFKDSDAAQELVDELSGPKGRSLWMRTAGTAVRPLFPSEQDPQPQDEIGKEVAHQLSGQNGQATELCFDASDVMPPQLRDAFYRAVLKYFDNYQTGPGELTALLDELDQVQSRVKGADRTGPPLDGICAHPASQRSG